MILFETNARLLLRRLSIRHGRPVTLDTVPEEEWQRLASRYDGVWLMGLWRRSPGARAEALRLHDLRRAYDEALPDWTEDDVGGSPYAVLEYAPDFSIIPSPRLRGEGSGEIEAGTRRGEDGMKNLSRLRRRLRDLGLRVIVDFVPNHLARDHPWTRTHPERFVGGDERARAEHPDWFFEAEPGTFLAHGRDPYFAPWTDTVQVNFFSRDMREAMIRELLRIARVADGVRCDMAMLALTDVVERTWGGVLSDPRPAEEFWAEAVDRVKRRHPKFRFLAEAYWGLEGRLLELGFDGAYDKGLYDRLRDGDAAGVREWLRRPSHPLRRAVQFVENHDEPRLARTFGERARAAATVVATLPGTWLVHDGQAEARQVRLPVQLIREPQEPVQEEFRAFHERLVAAAGDGIRDGSWDLVEPKPFTGEDPGSRNVLCWIWRLDRRVRVVAVNWSGEGASARIPVPGAPAVEWTDALGGAPVQGEAGELPLALDPWQPLILER